MANILAEAGIEPAPAPERDKKRTWHELIRSHCDTLYACDFFTVEVLGLCGADRYSVFFVMQLKTRAVELAGIGVNPDGEWMKNIARALTDPVDGFLRDASHLIHDADTLYTDAFKAILKPDTDAKGEGVASVQIPPRSPNCNPHAERFVRTIKSECLRHFVFFGERHLRLVLSEFLLHYHEERFHQGLGSKLIRPANNNARSGKIRRRSRLGGLLNYYHRDAA